MRYNQIRECDIANGEGIGVALFVQGCRFACPNCFNTETWDFNGGKEWTPEVKEKFLELIDRPYIKRISLLGGECLADENLDDILDLVVEINKRYNITQDIAYNNDNKHNILNQNADKSRLSCPNKTIWLYTGYEVNIKNYPYVDASDNYELKNQYNFVVTQPSKDARMNFIRTSIINNVDVLVDGKYIDSQRNPQAKWKGSDNQRVIDIKQSICQGEVVLWAE